MKSKLNLYRIIYNLTAWAARIVYKYKKIAFQNYCFDLLWVLGGKENQTAVCFLEGQARFETGNYKSRVCNDNKNLFGMRLAKVRPTTAMGESGGYACYGTYADSLSDVILWYDYNKIPLIVSNMTEIWELLSKAKNAKYFEANLNHYYAGVETGLRAAAKEERKPSNMITCTFLTAAAGYFLLVFGISKFMKK